MVEEVADKRIAPGSVLSNDGNKGGQMGLNRKLFFKIVIWWLVTVPVAFGVAAAIEWIIVTL